MSRDVAADRADALRAYRDHRERYIAASERWRQAEAGVRREQNGIKISGSHQPCPCGDHRHALQHAIAERDDAEADLFRLGHPHKGSDKVAAIDRAEARKAAVAELDERIAAMQTHRDKVQAAST